MASTISSNEDIRYQGRCNMEGTIDQVKVRIRTHAPSDVIEKEFNNVDEALNFLHGVEDGSI